MDYFGIIYQLKTKKFWWLDVVLYFAVALLLATIICFVIFVAKISYQEKKLKDLDNDIAQTGTAEQKELEKKVFEYQKKIDNFATILADHKNPTNILDLFEKIVLPNVWFNNFLITAITTQAAKLQVSGEAESTTALSRQISTLEQSEFIKDITSLNSESTETGKVRFSIGLSVNPDVFIPSVSESLPPGGILETTSPSSSLLFNKNIF